MAKLPREAKQDQNPLRAQTNPVGSEKGWYSLAWQMWEREGEESQRASNNSEHGENAPGPLLMVPRQVSWLKAREFGRSKSLNAVKYNWFIKVGLRLFQGPTWCLDRAFSTSAVLTFAACSFSAVGGYPVWCSVFHAIPGLHPLDANSTVSPVVNIKNVSRHCQVSPGGQYHHNPRTSVLKFQ